MSKRDQMFKGLCFRLDEPATQVREGIRAPRLESPWREISSADQCEATAAVSLDRKFVVNSVAA